MTAPAPQNIFDRVWETASAPGTGTVTLLGAKTGYRTFGSVLSNGSLVPYCIADQNSANWEVGVATWNTGGSLTRTAANVQAGSAGASTLVNFASGTQDVFLTAAASYLQQPQEYQDLAALLEPDAIQPYQYSTFSYAIASNTRRYMIAGWSTRLGSSGRLEVRNPQEALPLCGVTVTGLESGSSGIFLDPTVPVYADPKATYYSRRWQIRTGQTRYAPIAGNSQVNPFLPGPYGAIITRACNFDSSWIIGRYIGGANNWNMGDEIGDNATQSQRKSQAMWLAVSKACICEFATGLGQTGALGGITFFLCPSTWSAVTDPFSPYAFRDDFMGSSLDTTNTWNLAQSLAGNIAIDTTFQWVKTKGNSNWGQNGMYAKTSHARSSVPHYICDVYFNPGTSDSLCLGLFDGAGYSYTNAAHGLVFSLNPSGTITAYENGTSRGTVGSGISASTVYRVRVTANSNGSGKYEIQGGTQYHQIGDTVWDNITPGTTTSATNTLYAGQSTYSGQPYISDMRVY